MKWYVILLTGILIAACDITTEDGYLRGDVKLSSDGKTYFGILDNNGGACPLLVDGKKWNYPIGKAVSIEPGRHTISCGSSIEFEVPAGHIFMFDYWGP